jgi:hypothetical protein
MRLCTIDGALHTSIRNYSDNLDNDIQMRREQNLIEE